jgi:hypothetical protein
LPSTQLVGTPVSQSTLAHFFQDSFDAARALVLLGYPVKLER